MVLNWTWSKLVMVCPPFIPLPLTGNLELNLRAFWMKRNFSNNCITIIIIIWAESRVWSSFLTKTWERWSRCSIPSVDNRDRQDFWNQTIISRFMGGKPHVVQPNEVCMVNDGMINVALINIFIADKMYLLHVGHYSRCFTPKLYLSCVFIFR